MDQILSNNVLEDELMQDEGGDLFDQLQSATGPGSAGQPKFVLSKLQQIYHSIGYDYTEPSDRRSL